VLNAGAGVRGQVRSSFVGVWARQLWRSASDYLCRSCVRLLTPFKNTAVTTLCVREQGGLQNIRRQVASASPFNRAFRTLGEAKVLSVLSLNQCVTR
jgi:hypothetical protein